jgi:hypothetical protein
MTKVSLAAPSAPRTSSRERQLIGPRVSAEEMALGLAVIDLVGHRHQVGYDGSALGTHQSGVDIVRAPEATVSRR